MNQRCRLIRFLVLFLVGVWCVEGFGQQKTVVIHAGRMIDTAHKQVRDRISIVIEGSRISAVQDGFVSLKDAEIVDLSNATVLPGLIDCHKHLTAHLGTSSDFQDLVTEGIADSAFYAAANAKTTLLNGFTSVRDVGARGTVDVALKRAIEKELVIGPRIWAAGEIIGPTGGHSDNANGVAQGISSPEWSASIVDSPDQARKSVREHRRSGTDLIKIVPSGGVGSVGDDPKLQLMTNDEIKAVIDTAHSLGMKVAAHAHGKAAIDNSIRLGIDSIEHGTYADQQSFALMNEHGTYLVPTVYVAYSLFQTAKEHPEKLPPHIVAKIQVIAPIIQAMFTNANRAGVKIATGTDSMGNFRGGFTPAKELTEMVRLGMTPMDALAAATVNASDLIGDVQDIGSIEPGKFADIIAVPGDPLKDITEMERVAFVMKGGGVYKTNGKEVAAPALATR
jgi:imidazolonepropionase-like amidohydrolase